MGGRVIRSMALRLGSIPGGRTRVDEFWRVLLTADDYKQMVQTYDREHAVDALAYFCASLQTAVETHRAINDTVCAERDALKSRIDEIEGALRFLGKLLLQDSRPLFWKM